VLPAATLPKVVVVEGVTLKSARATPLAAAEHPLSLPALSTAVTRAKYVVPAVRAVMPVETVCPLVGVGVGDVIVKNDALGQVGVDVAR
jgi:hypothetical protein